MAHALSVLQGMVSVLVHAHHAKTTNGAMDLSLVILESVGLIVSLPSQPLVYAVNVKEDMVVTLMRELAQNAQGRLSAVVQSHVKRCLVIVWNVTMLQEPAHVVRTHMVSTQSLGPALSAPTICTQMVRPNVSLALHTVPLVIIQMGSASFAMLDMGITLNLENALLVLATHTVWVTPFAWKALTIVFHALLRVANVLNVSHPLVSTPLLAPAKHVRGTHIPPMVLLRAKLVLFSAPHVNTPLEIALFAPLDMLLLLVIANLALTTGSAMMV